MTSTTTGDAADAESEDARGRGEASKRRRRAIALGLVAAAVVGLVSWRLWTSHALGSVQVAWSGEPVCEGTSLRRDGHTIEARPDMSCVITVTVRNDGPVSVHLRRAVLPFAGPEGGPVIEAAEIDDRRPAADDGIDAAVTLDRDLDPGETWTFRTRVVFRDDGCTDGGTFTAHAWPTVEVSHLGRQDDVVSKRNLSIHRARQNSGCRG